MVVVMSGVALSAEKKAAEQEIMITGKINLFIFLTKSQKKANPRKKDLPSLKNDITSSEPTVKMLDT